MTAIRVQLVKHIVHLLGAIVWPASAAKMTMAGGMSGGICCCVRPPSAMD
jgi:hypothetical protein